LPHDCRLANPLHGLAEQPADNEEKADLSEEDRLRGTRWRAFRRESIRCSQHSKGCPTHPRFRAPDSSKGGTKFSGHSSAKMK
jgi:hypothetical protein